MIFLISVIITIFFGKKCFEINPVRDLILVEKH